MRLGSMTNKIKNTLIPDLAGTKVLDSVVPPRFSLFDEQTLVPITERLRLDISFKQLRGGLLFA
ncbi:hypothetical protein DNHGIG_27190 [Collibacillus ludicampi]|uniref:Uncharacterized protein n=1 Tax=Collibacillus ludicampi TaxID=2771369 RepID=A0AAV4LH48_9BACL|nr:hypothetical protein DNHGIG_27190 [Collibacillus ludicampi]